MSVSISRAALGLPLDAMTQMGTICFTQPEQLDLCVYRGDSGRLRVTITDADGVTPVDVSAATWDCDIRETVDGVQVGAMAVEPVEGTTNVVELVLTPTMSAALDNPPYVWDLEMQLNGEVTTLLAGNVTVTKDVSRVGPA